MQRTDVPGALAAFLRSSWSPRSTSSDASYFLSTIDFEVGERSSMPRWRTLLFLATCALAADAALAFELPATGRSPSARGSVCDCERARL